MNSAELDRLGRLMEEGAVPEWVRLYVQNNREVMMAKLQRGECLELTGPKGEKILIQPAANRTAA
ncbi:MAG TPA: hypothetical protein VK638_13990 [Edaphobacter sp.]|nr:hypothetical protein [Edaphobacter sp.]